MKRLLLIFIVILAICGTNGSELVRHKRQAAPKTTTTKKPVCKSQNFDSLKGCCSGSVDRFFTLDEIKFCARNMTGSPTLQKYSNYQLHTLFNTQNQLVLDAKTIKALGPLPCINECLFFKKGLLDANNKTQVQAIIDHFSKAASANWVAAGAPPAVSAGSTLMGEIVKQCAPLADAFTPTSLHVVWDAKFSQTCITGPAMFLQCMRKTIAHSCPPKLFNVKSAACNKTVNTLKVCGYFNTGVQFNV